MENIGRDLIFFEFGVWLCFDFVSIGSLCIKVLLRGVKRS